jgi:hypothetical protein
MERRDDVSEVITKSDESEWREERNEGEESDNRDMIASRQP